MKDKLKEFFAEYQRVMAPSSLVQDQLERLAQIVAGAERTVIVGNGGSNAIAGHVAEDWTKICGCPTITFNDTVLMSCFANDYGWKNWIAEAINRTGWNEHHIGIFISSSGRSPNILNGCKAANSLNMLTITFSGFDKNNPLTKLGHLNFHVPSYNYNIVESVHNLWLLSLCEIMRRKKS